MKVLFLFPVVFITNFAFATEFTNKLEVSKVYNSKSNRRGSSFHSKTYRCNDFKGTYADNSILVVPSAQGGSGKYTHEIVYTLAQGYKESHGDIRQKSLRVKDGKSKKIYLPELRDDVSFVQQEMMLLTKDKESGDTAVSRLMFNVSRPVILRNSTREEAQAKNCLEVYPAYTSTIGILSNSSSNPSDLIIRQGVQKLWTSLSGSQWGFFFSPLALTKLGNLVMFNKGFFKQYSKQVIESVEVSSGYQLSPGDYIQIYEQRTRYVTAFDAYTVDICGETELVDEDYMLQWWGLAYHAVPVSPFVSEPVPIETIGVYPHNTCDDEFTPQQSNQFEFLRMN